MQAFVCARLLGQTACRELYSHVSFHGREGKVIGGRPVGSQCLNAFLQHGNSQAKWAMCYCVWRARCVSTSSRRQQIAESCKIPESMRVPTLMLLQVKDTRATELSMGRRMSSVLPRVSCGVHTCPFFAAFSPTSFLNRSSTSFIVPTLVPNIRLSACAIIFSSIDFGE